MTPPPNLSQLSQAVYLVVLHNKKIWPKKKVINNPIFNFKDLTADSGWFFLQLRQKLIHRATANHWQPDSLRSNLPPYRKKPLIFGPRAIIHKSHTFSSTKPSRNCTREDDKRVEKKCKNLNDDQRVEEGREDDERVEKKIEKVKKDYIPSHLCIRIDLDLSRYINTYRPEKSL